MKKYSYYVFFCLKIQLLVFLIVKYYNIWFCHSIKILPVNYFDILGNVLIDSAVFNDNFDFSQNRVRLWVLNPPKPRRKHLKFSSKLKPTQTQNFDSGIRYSPWVPEFWVPNPHSILKLWHTIYSRNNMRQKCGGNCGLWILHEITQYKYSENLRKIVGALWELPAK